MLYRERFIYFSYSAFCLPSLLLSSHLSHFKLFSELVSKFLRFYAQKSQTNKGRHLKQLMGARGSNNNNFLQVVVNNFDVLALYVSFYCLSSSWLNLVSKIRYIMYMLRLMVNSIIVLVLLCTKSNSWFLFAGLWLLLFILCKLVIFLSTLSYNVM